MIKTKTIQHRSDYASDFDKELGEWMALLIPNKALTNWKLAGDARFLMAVIVYDSDKLPEGAVTEKGKLA